MPTPDDDARKGGRVAVIGDLAGHRQELEQELLRLGADRDSGALPADLTVIQVGDLIHRGPDSEGIVALVDRYLGTQPEQWIQLAGNHEAQYVREPAFQWPERIGEDAVATLRSWWNTGRLRAAAAIRAPDEDFLITHAGLSEGYWRAALASPARADLAADAINSFIGTHEDVLFLAGMMLGGGAPLLSAGPVWAEAGHELVRSWTDAGRRLPFSQVHGHSTVVDRRPRRVGGPRRLGGPRPVGGRRPEDPATVYGAPVTVDRSCAHEFVALPGGRIIGVDPGHSRSARPGWRAFVLADAFVTAR